MHNSRPQNRSRPHAPTHRSQSARRRWQVCHNCAPVCDACNPGGAHVNLQFSSDNYAVFVSCVCAAAEARHHRIRDNGVGATMTRTRRTLARWLVGGAVCGSQYASHCCGRTVCVFLRSTLQTTRKPNVQAKNQRRTTPVRCVLYLYQRSAE